MGLGLGLTVPRAGAAAAPAFDPATLASLEAWYRGDTAPAAGSSLTTWTNQAPSGASRDLAATAGAEPQLFTDANFNGQPVLGTTAGADEVRSMGFANNWSSPVAQPVQVFMALRLPASSASQIYWFIEANGSVSGTPCFYGTTSATATTDGVSTLAVTLVEDTTYIACLEFNGVSSAVYLNRYSTAHVSGPTGASGMNGMFIGTGGGSPGRWRIGEIIVCSAIESKQSVMQYMGTRYGVSVVA